MSEIVFLVLGPWASKLLTFDLKIGFLVKNCICCQLEMPGIPNLGQKIMKTICGCEYDVWASTLNV